MYEDTIAAAAAALSQRGDTPNKKLDHTYKDRMVELLAKLDTMGFGGWAVGRYNGQEPGTKATWSDPKVLLTGVEISSGEPVELELANNHGRMVPKHMSFSMYRASTGRGLVIGQHVGTFRITDLRTKTSQYDGADWGETHFTAMLAVAAFRGKLVIPTRIIVNHLGKAIAKMEELGITEPRHCLLPRDGAYTTQGIDMVPYLVGKYGDMPVALVLKYKQQDRVTIHFYIIGPRGFCTLDFGNLEVDEYGYADGQVDVAKLLAGPGKK